jgi:serpin B
MKKIIALLLCVVTIIGMLAGCSKSQEQPTDVSSLSGTYIRTTNGANMIIVDNYGPIVLSGLNNEFKKVQSGSEIKITTGAIAESYPAQASAETMEVVKVKPLNIYEEKYKTLIEMGWYPTQLLVTLDPDENYIVHSGDIEQSFKHSFTFKEENEIVVCLSNEKELNYESFKNDAKDIAILFQYEIKTPDLPEKTIDYKENYDAMSTILDAIDEGENIIYSPLSFNIAMGMLSNGIADDLKEPFKEYYGFTPEEYNEFAQYYLSQNDEVTKHANSIWIRKDFVLNEKFQEIVKKYFDAECKNVEFEEQFVKDLNNWCKEKTNNLIPSILKNPPSPEYKCFLVNALYFKGEWESKYKKNAVRDTDFTMPDNKTIQVSGMFGEENIYMENDNATAFMKMYEDNKYAFIGILPKEEGDFKFADLNIESLIDSKRTETVYTMLPKFKFDNSNILTDVIDEVGLGGLKEFGSLPGIINEKDDLTVGFILQKAVIDVSEEGTEAAAVTIIGTTVGCVAPIDDTKQVYLDRPFAFMIYDVENNVVLFAGKVVNPNN